MELKATEQEVSSLRSLYSTIYLACSQQMPDVAALMMKPPDSDDDDNDNEMDTAAEGLPMTVTTTAESIQQHWEDWNLSLIHI